MPGFLQPGSMAWLSFSPDAGRITPRTPGGKEDARTPRLDSPPSLPEPALMGKDKLR